MHTELVLQAGHTRIWRSPISLCRTSQAQAGWRTSQYHYFRSLQRCSIGLCLDCSKTFTDLSWSHSLFCLGCAFQVIVMSETEPSLHYEVLSALEQVFLKDVSVLWSVLIFSHDLDESLGPCCWKTSGDEWCLICSRCRTWHSELNLGLTIWPENHGPIPL